MEKRINEFLKPIKVKVSTPKGDRYLMFQPFDDTEKMEKLPCESVCPYGIKVCEAMPDPRDPSNKAKCFANWCTELGREADQDKILVRSVPAAGTIESSLGDFKEIYQALLEKNPMVRLTEVIDCVCSGGCDMYNESHSNCNHENKFCILRNLFKNERIPRT